MQPSSSAQPTTLARYSLAGSDVGARVEAEARRLEAALTPFLGRCSEYHVAGVTDLAPRLSAYGRHEAELAAWAAEVARGFQRADTRATPGLLGPGLPPLTRRQAVEAWQTAQWNAQARRLIGLMRLIRQAIAQYGLGGAVTKPELLIALMALAAPAAGTVFGLVAAGDAPRRAAQPAHGLPEGAWQLLQGFWYESMEHVDMALFRSFSAELDALNLATAAALGSILGTPRTPAQAEAVVSWRTGALDVTAAQAFPWTGACTLSGAPFRPSAADSMAGDHSGISYFPGEQVRLERLNGATGDYRVSITGLDPKKPGATNNFEAVVLTAQGERAGNHYYQEVRQRVLASIAALPPGSTLHLEGHSMGGGVCLLLREDPAVLQALVAGGVTVGSLITFGTVRPRGADDAPRDEASPFAGAEERHYVNVDDSLARGVGAGHGDDPSVILLDNRQIEDPAEAHNDYGDLANYSELAPELQTMPYVVDPATYVAYSPVPAEQHDERSSDVAP